MALPGGITQLGERFVFTIENGKSRRITLRHDGWGAEDSIATDSERVRVSSDGDLAINLDLVNPRRRVVIMAIDSSSHDVIVDSNC